MGRQLGCYTPPPPALFIHVSSKTLIVDTTHTTRSKTVNLDTTSVIDNAQHTVCPCLTIASWCTFLMHKMIWIAILGLLPSRSISWRTSRVFVLSSMKHERSGEACEKGSYGLQDFPECRGRDIRDDVEHPPEVPRDPPGHPGRYAREGRELGWREKAVLLWQTSWSVLVHHPLLQNRGATHRAQHMWEYHQGGKCERFATYVGISSRG